MQCFEPVMMEDFGAQDGPAREVCTDKVLDCDVLVGIIGIRYGDHPPDDQTSYTELEFQTAVDNGLSRLMFLLDEEVARGLEGDRPQGDDRADRQEQLRKWVGTDRVSEMAVGTERTTTVGTEEDFGKRLAGALETWVRERSFKRALVDHSAEFQAARRRLLYLGERTGGATLIFGEPGTGKTTLFNALLDDIPLRHAYDRLIGPVRIWLAEGEDAVEQARAQVDSVFDDFARQQAGGTAGMPPVLIALHLESDIDTGKEVDARTLSMLPRLFSWNAPRAVVLAETNNRQVMEFLESELNWLPGAVITIPDYADIGDALEQMRRDAPEVREWPQPGTEVLAQALGLRPISLYAAAKDIESQARRSPHRVPGIIQKQLDAIAHEKTRAGKYGALIRNSIDHLSPEARELLALMTVLHPKPTLFPDEIAVAFDLSLDLDEAIGIATGEEDELDAAGRQLRDKAYDLVGDLVGRGLLERMPRHGASHDDSAELLTLHPANVRPIRDYLQPTDEKRAEGHARAEAFYRALVGEAVSGSFDSRFRMEDNAWWDDVEEWIYHLGHVEPTRAGMAYATLFLDAYWWWDLYVKFDFCDKLLDYADRPRVRAVSPDMPEITRLLAQFRRTYPREHEATRAEILAEIAGDDPARTEGLRQTARTGTDILPMLKELCGLLGITELDALFPDAPLPASTSAVTADPESGADQTRLHLLGLMCLFLGEGHRFHATLNPQGEALAAAEACYQYAESYFRAEENDWDLAWACYLHGEIIAKRGGDPAQAWDEASSGATDDGDTELLANIERTRAGYFRGRGDLDGALAHYGRAVFYGQALQVTSNLDVGADAYTQAFYHEMRLHAAKMLAEPLLANPASPLDDRKAEARRRLEVMLAEWGGSWTPDPDRLDQALGSVNRERVEESADAIAEAAFPPGPGDAILSEPDSRYYRQVDDLIERTKGQHWVTGLDRWEKRRGEAGGG